MASETPSMDLTPPEIAGRSPSRMPTRQTEIGRSRVDRFASRGERCIG